MTKMKASKSYKEVLLASLKDPEEAAEYLNAALEEGDEEALWLALRNVAEANGLNFERVEHASAATPIILNALSNTLHLRFATAAK